MKDIERRLGSLEKRTGSELIVLRVVEDRGQPVQVEDSHGISDKEMDAAVERYMEDHPDDQGTHGILVLYFDRDENGVVKAVSQWDRLGEREDSKR